MILSVTSVQGSLAELKLCEWDDVVRAPSLWMMTRKRKVTASSNIKDKWGLRILGTPVVSSSLSCGFRSFIRWSGRVSHSIHSVLFRFVFLAMETLWNCLGSLSWYHWLILSWKASMHTLIHTANLIRARPVLAPGDIGTKRNTLLVFWRVILSSLGHHQLERR